MTRDGLPPETTCPHCGARARELVCHLCKTPRPSWTHRPPAAEACTDLDPSTYPKESP